MDDKTIQRKLNQIAKLATELKAEATKRWGSEAQLFMEPESGLFLMSGDALERGDTMGDRQNYIEFHTTKHCPIEAGGW